MIDQYKNLMKIRSLFAEGRNVLQELNKLERQESTDVENIAIAYDLQAGEYVAAAKSNIERWRRYGLAISEVLRPNLEGHESLLDCGTGELTSLAASQTFLGHEGPIMGMDISWSRLAHGRKFWHSILGKNEKLELFVGDISHIPLPSKSVDVVLTVHALEPNYGHELQMLSELLRVCRKRLILLEPSFENASSAGQDRMKSHNYIRNLPSHIDSAGGRLISFEALEVPMNSLNPTWIHVVEPKVTAKLDERSNVVLQCPVTMTPLEDHGQFLWSPLSGLAYPVMREIPLLRAQHAVLASSFSEIE
jgi:ubiquinone/menaquinone biosynthesis C-methylase UbiE/uncharacterized protein YbaR (Trm112 family)